MRTRVIHATTEDEIRRAAKEGADALRSGALVGFATETVYGLAALASLGDAMGRLRDLKDRPARPFSVHVASPGDVARYVAAPPPQASRLIERAWPGPVTVLLPTGGRLADQALQGRGLHNVLTHEGLIGLRCPDQPAATALLAAADAPVVAPSANLAGKPSPRSAQDVLDSLDGRIELLLDSGPTRLGADSTIVRFGPAPGEWKIAREGALDAQSVQRMLRRTILLVCTGNTCRSPIAAGIARKLLAEHAGCRVSELQKRGIEVVSAGVVAGEGARATPEAVAAARAAGADIAHHRSRKLTSELIQTADLVLCMTAFHVAEATRLLPSAADRIVRLDTEKDIADPVGGGPEAYRQAASVMAESLRERLRRGEL